MGIIEAAWHYTKLIIMVALGIWVIWWGITNSEVVAGFIVTIINGIKNFFMTLFAGVF